MGFLSSAVLQSGSGIFDLGFVLWEEHVGGRRRPLRRHFAPLSSRLPTAAAWLIVYTRRPFCPPRSAKTCWVAADRRRRVNGISFPDQRSLRPSAGDFGPSNGAGELERGRLAVWPRLVPVLPPGTFSRYAATSFQSISVFPATTIGQNHHQGEVPDSAEREAIGRAR